MNKLIISLLFLCFTISVNAQIVKQNEQFTTVNMIEGKVAFVKEVQLPKGMSNGDSYDKLKKWSQDNFGNDPFKSSIRTDASKSEIIARARIELILPENAQGVREKMTMRFRINGFLVQDKCVLEILDISFLYENAKDRNLPKVIKAKDFITNEMLAIKDPIHELRINTQKSALYYLNNIGRDFEKRYGY